MEYIVLFFLAVSLLFYVLFGGADFGIGMIEPFAPRRLRARVSEVSYRAIGPVWEANHIWLILVVVILFVGFPKVYATLSVGLHIPLSLFLFGVILRGCAFTFRHYDAIKDGSERVYSAIFHFASFWTPLWLGVCVAAVINGRFPNSEGAFAETYVLPWTGLFPFSLGVFLCLLCMLLAAVYVLGEDLENEARTFFESLARRLLPLALLTGLIVFLLAEFDGVPLFTMFQSQTLSPACAAVVLVTAVLLSYSISRRRHWWARSLVGLMVSAILIGWFALMYPAALFFEDGSPLLLLQHAAPPATLRGLTIALIVGSMLIFPALAFLFWTFKARPED